MPLVAPCVAPCAALTGKVASLCRTEVKPQRESFVRSCRETAIRQSILKRQTLPMNEGMSRIKSGVRKRPPDSHSVPQCGARSGFLWWSEKVIEIETGIPPGSPKDRKSSYSTAFTEVWIGKSNKKGVLHDE